MKIIRLEISISHSAAPDTDDLADHGPTDWIDEDLSLSVGTTLDDQEPSAAALGKLCAELQRRFECINARKTN